MANEQYAFLKTDKIPTREAWQDAIDQSPFDLTLDPELDLKVDAGFSPCILCGEETGVEIYFDDSPKFLSEFAEIAADRDCCVSFRWGGSEMECAVALILSYVLAKEFDAVISYEGEPPTSIEQLLEATKGMLAECGF